MIAPRARVDVGRVTTVAAPAALATVLVGYALGARSMWLDEGATVAIASQHGAALWQGIARDGGNMLAYYLLVHVVVATFGHGLVALRLPSAIADAATVAIVAALGLQLFDGDRRVALTAAVLTAVSLPLIFWGQDARGYALMTALVAASFLALSIALAAPPGQSAPRGPLLVYGFTLLAALYVGFDAVLVVPAQLLLASRAGRIRSVLVVVVSVAGLCLPLIALALARGAGQLFWVSGPSVPVLGQALVTLTSAGLPPDFRDAPLTTVTTALTITVALGGLGLVRRRVDGPLVQRQVNGRPPAHSRWLGRWIDQAPVGPLLPALWLLVPALLALTAAFAGEPVELARSSVALIPALALVLAWRLHSSGVSRRVAWAGVGALLCLRLGALVPAYGVSPENWKAAVHYVLAATRAPACVAFYPEDGRMAFDYYLSTASTAGRLTPVLPNKNWRAVAPYVDHYAVPSRAGLGAISARCPQLWLVSSHAGQQDGPPASQRDLQRYDGLLDALSKRYAYHALRTFGYAAQVRVELLRRSATASSEASRTEPYGRRPLPTNVNRLIATSSAVDAPSSRR